MDAAEQPILRIPDTVRKDVLGYRDQIAKFLRSVTCPLNFVKAKTALKKFPSARYSKYNLTKVNR